MKFGVLIPVHNEEKTVGEVVKAALAEGATEIIVVDDGSTDRSPEIIKRIAAATWPARIVVLEHEINKGLSDAMRTGFAHALGNGFDLIIKCDGDGQMNLGRIAEFVSLYTETGADVICACRERSTPWMLKKDMTIYGALFYLASGTWISDMLSEFRSYSRKAMQAFYRCATLPMASNIAIIDLIRRGCSVREIKGGVGYYRGTIRSAPLRMLLDMRIQFVRSVLAMRTFGAITGAIAAVAVLSALLLFNLTVGMRYNSARRKGPHS